MGVAIKRSYEPAAAGDGKRILIDRLWPRGLSREKADIDLWLKEVAPSTALRKWFGHDPAKWTEFQARYRAELHDSPAFAELKQAVSGHKATLIYSAKDERHNDAVVLQSLLSKS